MKGGREMKKDRFIWKKNKRERKEFVASVCVARFSLAFMKVTQIFQNFNR